MPSFPSQLDLLLPAPAHAGPHPRSASVVRPVLLVAALTLAACSASPETPRLAIRDSADVRIVEWKGELPRQPAFTLDTIPVFRYGDDNGERLLGNVRMGALAPDGSAVVADLQTDEILVFDSAGELRGVFGGTGSGPTEMTSIVGLQIADDGILVVQDLENGRFTGWHTAPPDLAWLRRAPGSLHNLFLVGAPDPDRLILRTSGYRVPEPGWLEGALVRFDAHTGRADTLGAFDFHFTPPAGTVHPFRPSGEIAVSSEGIIVGRTDRPRLDWLDENGDLRQSFRWEAAPRFPTDSLWRALGENLRALGRLAGAPEAIERRLREWREAPPKPLPLYGFIVPGPAGEAWLAQYTPGNDTVKRFQVVSGSGEPLGPVLMPPRFRVLDVADDRVLGVLHDQLDLQSVVVLPLYRGTDASARYAPS